MILRECIRHEPLARAVLHSRNFSKFFDYVELNTFDIAIDAFATFKVCLSSAYGQELLTRHKAQVAEYLNKNYDFVHMVLY